MECYLFTIVITNKKMINFNKLEFPIYVVPYGMLLTYNYHPNKEID